MLLDNTPEMAFLLGAAALGGQVVVGLNPTRRGAALAADIRARRLPGGRHRRGARRPARRTSTCRCVPLGLARTGRTCSTSTPAAPVPDADVGPDDADDADLHVGHLRRPEGGQRHPGEGGLPRACSCPSGSASGPTTWPTCRCRCSTPTRSWPAGARRSRRAPRSRWRGGSRASGFLADVRRYGATYANYVGKPLAYILATPEQPDDADNPLRLVFGNEANERDIAEFGRRFGCVVVDSYSSTENAVIVQRVPEMPPGSLGRPLDGVKVLDPETMAEMPGRRVRTRTAGCSTPTRRPASW